ncbi:MAG: glycoside hydrolase family 2 TIM barrel-domain containing protein [Planctomycetota bacterium]
MWLNGRRVAAHEGGATPFEVDVTDAARRGDNVLAVRVREHTTTSDALDKMSQYADFPLAGIIRPVTLFCVPCVHVAAIVPEPALDPAGSASLHVRIAVVNEGEAPFARGQLTIRVRDDARRELAASAPLELSVAPWERREVEVDVRVPGAKPWTAESPNLCELAIDLSSTPGVSELIGFRQVAVRGTEILVNGAPVKLRGTCHHDSHPLLGRAVSAELERQDVELIKEANLNALRTSHYPPRRELLDAADRRGLYVEDEASFCWVGADDDLRLTPRILQLTAELVARDRHHPSVIIWSVCNESQFGAGFERAAQWLKRTDATRPLSAATSAWLDLATLHNPIAITRIDEHEHLDKPLLFDESFAPFQGIFGDVAELWVDPGMHDYYAEPLPSIYARFMASQVTQGSMIWCFADDIFCVPNRGLEYGRGFTACHFLEPCYHVPGRGLVGDAPWGIVDGWRRKKPEFWIVKKLHSPVRIAERALAATSPLRVAVANQFDFTDLAALELGWRLGDESGTAAPAVAARSQGEIVIEPRHVAAGQLLELTFTARDGRIVDAYRLPVGEAPVGPQPIASAALPVVQPDEVTLAGAGARITAGDLDLVIDRATGQLRRCVAFGEPLLLELPRVHILPTADPLTALPRSFALLRLEVLREDDAIHVVIEGTHEDLAGRYDLTIARGPAITVRSEFRYQGPELRAREVGMRFSVPREWDELAWQRDAEWSVYPDDHVGRPSGSARAFPPHDERVPPEWPWSQDHAPMGSNDFRSTKRNLRWAVIAAPGGPGVRIDADGVQHLRASVASDRVQVHVSDWYGGTNVGWWEWVHNYGNGKVLRAGDTIRSTLRLQLVPRRARASK